MFLPQLKSRKGSWIMFHRSYLRLSIVLAGFVFGGAASATEFCNVKKTADGFVALRSGPSAGAKLIGRMKVGDEVMLDNTVASAKGFTRVTWWQGGRFKSANASQQAKPSGQGWVNSKLLEDDCG